MERDGLIRPKARRGPQGTHWTLTAEAPIEGAGRTALECRAAGRRKLMGPQEARNLLLRFLASPVVCILEGDPMRKPTLKVR